MKLLTIPSSLAIACMLALGVAPGHAKSEKPVKTSAINDLQKTKPRKERGRPEEVLSELTPRGKELEKAYHARMKSLKEEIQKQLPTVDPARKEGCIQALQAIRAAEKNIDSKAHAYRAAIQNKKNDLKRDSQLLADIPAKVAGAELMLKRAMALPDGDEIKALAVEEANESLAKFRDPAMAEKMSKKVAGLKAGLEANLPKETELLKDVEAARKALEETKAAAYKAVDALGVDALLGGDPLDGKLAAYVMLAEATPADLARYAQQGSEQEKRIERLLGDKDLLVQIMVADGAYWEKFGPAMEVYEAIQKASPRAKDGVFQRLALATSLRHAVPMSSAGEEDEDPVAGGTEGPSAIIDPVQRYLSYEKAYLAGELDPGFDKQNTWELKMVMDGNEPVEIAEWGRQMLRSYRPDLVTMDDTAWRYVMAVNTEINYTSAFQKLGWDDPKLNNYQNILANGGICGRRAFFGRFILRSFGVAATARPQGGHAALVHWSPKGWVPCLGGGWGASNRTICERYAKDLDFLASSQARNDEKAFLRVKRAQWIADLLGEPRTYGYVLQVPEFWYSVSLIEQNRIIDRLQSKRLDAVGEDLGEAEDGGLGNATAYQVPAADRQITVDGKGVINVPAAACSSPAKSTDVILFMPSNLGGSQLHYTRYGTTDTFAYTIDAPKAGKYKLTARLVTPAPRQHLYLSVNGALELDIALPYTVGLWGELEPVTVELKQGTNQLSFGRGHFFMRGVSIRDFTLTPVP